MRPLLSFDVFAANWDYVYAHLKNSVLPRAMKNIVIQILG